MTYDEKTLRAQWHDYGSRPPIARWTSRISLILGVTIAMVVTLAAVVGLISGLIWLIVTIWKAIL